MLIIITRAVHIGACLILLSLFAFDILIATPALRQADRSALQHMEVLRAQFRLLAVWFWHCVVLDRVRTNDRRECVGNTKHRFDRRRDHSNAIRKTVDMALGSNAPVYTRELLCITEVPERFVEIAGLAVCWGDYCDNASCFSCVGWTRGSNSGS